MCHYWHMTTSTPTHAVTLAELVRGRREDKGLSRDSLAHTVGSSLSTITRIELNHTMASPATLADIAEELGISNDELAAATRATREHLSKVKAAG